jgi:hypothetical protein
VADDLDVILVIHRRSPAALVAPRKAHRLDQVDRGAEAGGKAQDGADIAGDLGLEQGDAHALLPSALHSEVTSRSKSLLAKPLRHVYQAREATGGNRAACGRVCVRRPYPARSSWSFEVQGLKHGNA